MVNSYKQPGRRGHRYRKQINNRIYDKYFYGNKEQREHDYQLWVAQLISENKTRRIDGSKTWKFFAQAGANELDVSKYVSHADKKTTERHYIDKETLRQAEARARLAHLEQMKKFVSKLPDMVQK